MKISLALGAITALVVGATALVSYADGRTKIVKNEATKTECSACHMAYSPSFLPKESWQAIMGDLENHFGEDASLDPALTAEIEAYLALNAANWRSVSNPPPLRITELRWFRGEHGSRTRKRAISDPNIGSMSNCQGCHRGADRGWFDDD